MQTRQLYFWQQDCLRLWFENGCRGVAGVATGAGKTLLAFEAAARLQSLLPDKALRVRIVVPRVFLANQWKSELAAYFKIPEREIGLWFGERKDAADRPFMIYVLNSARYCISRHILSDVKSGHPVLLVCDEVHHFGSAENAHVFDFVPCVKKDSIYSLGLSATPESERFPDVIEPAVGPLFYRYGLEEATRHNITAPYQLFHIATPFSGDEQDEYSDISARIAKAEIALRRACPHFFSDNHADYIRKLNQLIREGGRAADIATRLKRLYFQRKRVLILAKSRVLCGTELARLLAGECKTIFFTERIATANQLYENFTALFPGKTGLYHSAMHPEKKKSALERYSEGRTRMLVCCRALDEGLNVPDTEAAVIISSSSGERQRIQRIGRVLRKTPEEIAKRIFYLYVPATAESPEYLPGANANAQQLCFNMESGSIQGREYDKLAYSALGRLEDDGATERQLTNALHQIEKGRITADWRLPVKEIKDRLQNCISQKDPAKNYWAIMLLIARAEVDSL